MTPARAAALCLATYCAGFAVGLAWGPVAPLIAAWLAGAR